MKWYSCEESNVKFWIHEWFKHGSCTNFNELEYFRNGLKLYDYIIGYGLVNKCGTRSDNNCYAYFDKNFQAENCGPAATNSSPPPQIRPYW